MPTITLKPEVIDIPEPDISDLVTEDDSPLVNIFSERQMHLLKDSLYTSWHGPGEGRPFVAMVNVGLFFAPHEDPLVPDVLVSLDVRPPEDVWLKQHRSYFVWEYGKPPDVVIEIVSNRKGGELSDKRSSYARLGIAYYVVYDPDEQLSTQVLHVYERRRTAYVEMPESWLDDLGLGLTLWQGESEGVQATWLR
ncbi:MAG: Uma2 family endonuclease [Caldilineaceae bacterium]